MNFDGFQPQAVPRFGSYVASDDVTQSPIGIASNVQNGQYRTQSFSIRDGIGVKLRFGTGNSVGSLGVLRYLAADTSGQENISIIACTADGNVWSASPYIQGSRTQLTSPTMLANSGLSLVPNLSPQCAQAYNRMIVARGNLMIGKAQPLIVDGATLACDPVSDKPFGDPWIPFTQYRTGQVASPTGDAAVNIYYCKVGGVTSNAEPIWPLIEGATVVDGTVTWAKLEIVCTSGLEPPAAPLFGAAPAGTLLPAGASIFLVCTWTNQYGESLGSVVKPDGTIGNVLQYTNATGGAVDLSIVLPPVPPDIIALPSQYAVLSCNVYGYVVAGTPDPLLYLDPTSYAYAASNSPGATLTLSATPTGAQLPQTNNAFTTGAGNIATGTRYMIVLYMSRTGYITGFSGPAPIRCDISVDSRQILVQNIPIGPYNCIARICAFTVAGQGTGGPYFYIAADDFEDPGLGGAKIKQTATKIPDNVTTSAYFDFLDTYLPGASNVTNYFDRVEVPPCSDVYFSKGLNRVIYTGCLAFPASCLVSDLEDAEAIRIPGSIVNASLTDGDRTVCWRESGTMQVIFKENSGHSVTPNDGDPQDWDVNEIWRGSGPCNPRAIDSATADGEKLTMFAHRTGGYMWNSGAAPSLLTQELQGTPEEPGWWDRINWEASAQICVRINLKERLGYFFVPMDGALTNNKRITLNFFYGTDDPIIFITRTGREVPNISGRKWSLDDIAGNDCVYVPQRTSST